VKRLVLLRHAKSSNKSLAATDHERPLKGRGRRDAPVIGLRIVQRGWDPDTVLCSSAARAVETWERLGIDAPCAIVPALYHASGTGLIDHLRGLGDSIDTAMAIGHNPGWEDAVEQLSGEETRMTTCNAALLESTEDSWDAAFGGKWTLVTVLRPRPPRG